MMFFMRGSFIERFFYEGSTVVVFRETHFLLVINVIMLCLPMLNADHNMLNHEADSIGLSIEC